MKERKTTAPIYQPQWRAGTGNSGPWKNLVFPITYASMALAGMVANTVYQFRYVLQTMPPAPATGLTMASRTTTSITISWTASTGVTI